jgi:hypothetical protein
MISFLPFILPSSTLGIYFEMYVQIYGQNMTRQDIESVDLLSKIDVYSISIFSFYKILRFAKVMMQVIDPAS